MVARLTRRHRPRCNPRDPRNFGVRVRPAQGRCEATGGGPGSIPCPLAAAHSASPPWRRGGASRGMDAVGFGLTPDAKFNLAGFVAAGAARRERSPPRGTLERRMKLREGGRAIKFHARCSAALVPIGRMLDSLHGSPYVRASRWHSPIWSANSL